MAAVVLRGRPIAKRANSARAEDGVFDQLACNKGPRSSLAGYLTAAQLRHAKALPGRPGRLPAPRQELSCVLGALPPELPAVVFPEFARGASPLPPSSPGGPPPNPHGGPGPSPGPTPGPVPSPGPLPITPPGGGPGVPPGPCGCPPSWEGPQMRGYPRTINFHLSGEVSGGSVNTELRFAPRIDRPFKIRSVDVVPIAGVAVGQYVDVLLTTSDWPGDVATFLGSSIFTAQQALSELPLEDRDVGLPVSNVPYDVPMAFEVRARSQTIAVQTRFTAPAVGLPQLHVVVVIEEYDSLDVPIDPRPPLLPPPAPPLGPPGPEAAPPPVVVAVPVPPYRPAAVGVCGPQRYAFGPVCPLPVFGGERPVYADATQATLSGQAALQATRYNGAE